MKCSQFKEMAELYALNALDALKKADYEKHIAECNPCRERADQTLRVLSRLEDSFKVESTPIPAAADICRLATRLEMQKVGSHVRLRPMLRIAASILVCLGLSVFLMRGLLKSSMCECSPWTKDGFTTVAGTASDYPYLSGKRIYALRKTPEGNRIVALEKGSGVHVWMSACNVLDGAISSDVDNIYLWTQDAAGAVGVSSLDKRTGSLKWTVQANADASISRISRPVETGGMLLRAEGSSLRAVDAATGSSLWTSRVPSRDMLSDPAADDRGVYIASARHVYAYDSHSGESQWERAIEGGSSTPVKPHLLLNTQGLFMANAAAVNGALRKIRTSDGSVVWTRATGRPLSIKYARGSIVMRSDSVEAFDSRSGTSKWKVDIGGCSPVAWQGGRIFVVDDKNQREVVSIDLETGAEVGAFLLASSCSGLVVEGDMGYLNSNDGVLHAVNINEG